MSRLSGDLSWSVVYRDRWLLVLDKPSGLLSVTGRGPDKQDCLAKRVAVAFRSVRIVHRLDRDTSGLIAMALDAATQRELGRQFEARSVVKRYVALVAGSLQPANGSVQAALGKDFDHPPRHRVDPLRGRPAITDWQVLRHEPDHTRVALHPRTGRSHQLRVHLQHLGHPILGDRLYADPQSQIAADRLMLHAERLQFDHPATGERQTFESPCPF